MNAQKRPEEEFEKHDSAERSAASTENAKDEQFAEGEQSEEQLEETDQSYQDALMDTYNG